MAEPTTAQLRAAYERMATNECILHLLSMGVVKEISTVVRAPFRDPCPF
ncbi:MAG: hypothetical protein ACTSPE_00405 [Candidatus Thorarchaeota archaeon]